MRIGINVGIIIKFGGKDCSCLKIIMSCIWQALNQELASGKPNLDDVVLAGAELKKQMAGADDISKLDRDVAHVKDRYETLASRCDDRLARLQEALPLTQKFHDEHERLMSWLQRVEPELHTTGKEPTGAEADKQLDVCVYLSNFFFYKCAITQFFLKSLALYCYVDLRDCSVFTLLCC